MAKKKTATKKTPKLHLHLENASRLNELFEATPKRVRDALARFPDLAGRVRVTIGYDGDVLEKHVPKADVLFCPRLNVENIEKRAPKLKWIHIHGAGVEHLMPLDWLPAGMTLMNSSGVHGRRATEYAATRTCPKSASRLPNARPTAARSFVRRSIASGVVRFSPVPQPGSRWRLC